MIREQAQDIADTTQPGNVDKTTEAHRTSTRNKKNPSIRGKDFYGEQGIQLGKRYKHMQANE